MERTKVQVPARPLHEQRGAFATAQYHRASASATAGHSGGARPDDFRYLQEVGYPFWEGGSTPDRRTIQRA